MNRWQVQAVVRQHGAIGIFYPQVFIVEAPADQTAQQTKDAWFEQHGSRWELQRFVRIRDEVSGVVIL